MLAPARTRHPNRGSALGLLTALAVLASAALAPAAFAQLRLTSVGARRWRRLEHRDAFAARARPAEAQRPEHRRRAVAAPTRSTAWSTPVKDTVKSTTGAVTDTVQGTTGTS